MHEFCTSVVAEAVASKQAQVQMAVAAKLARMNTGNEESVVQLIKAATANMQQAAKAAVQPDLGTSIDIAV